MERDSLIYKLRRRGQILFQKILPDEFMSKLYSCIVLKTKVDLKNPQTFNEKIQWLKIHEFPFNAEVIQCADKYAVRDYLQEKGLGNRLVPIIGVWDNPVSIPWDELPNQFVLKCNHGCAYNIICTDKNSFDSHAAVKQLEKWLKEDFGVYNIEPHYSKIKPRLITCEEFLGKPIIDYKFFCFNGVPKYIYISTDLVHDRQAKIGFYYLDGRKIPLIRNDYSPMEVDAFPPCFENMRRDAEILSASFPFVRVDFFLANNTYYFAELTFTPSAGMMPFNPNQFDLDWGMELDIYEIMENKKRNGND